MRTEEIERIRESAVFAFMSEHGGSVLLREKTNRAFIEVPGPSAKWIFIHLGMIVLTLGLWTPVAIWDLYARRERIVICHVLGTGEIVWTTA